MDICCFCRLHEVTLKGSVQYIVNLIVSVFKMRCLLIRKIDLMLNKKLNFAVITKFDDLFVSSRGKSTIAA